MKEAPEKRQLFREAADLAIRLQDEQGDPMLIDTVREWVSQSSEHEAAWIRVAEIHGMAGRILTDQHNADVRMTRRKLLTGGGVALGAAAGAAFVLPATLRSLKADYTTTTAEIRDVNLPDGSSLTLGPNSAVALNFSQHQREVELISGMAYFDVAREVGRPFSARAGSTRATALGTAFDISNDADFISVSVDRGQVEVRSAQVVTAPAHVLDAGQWLTLDPSAMNPVRGTRDGAMIASWRNGMIIAEEMQVSALIAKLARWHSGPVIIADPFVASRVVSGVFDLSNPTRAIEAAVRPFGMKVHTLPFMTVISVV